VVFPECCDNVSINSSAPKVGFKSMMTKIKKRVLSSSTWNVLPEDGWMNGWIGGSMG
jgi:hypothetical protein